MIVCVLVSLLTCVSLVAHVKVVSSWVFSCAQLLVVPILSSRMQLLNAYFAHTQSVVCDFTTNLRSCNVRHLAYITDMATGNEAVSITLVVKSNDTCY